MPSIRRLISLRRLITSNYYTRMTVSLSRPLCVDECTNNGTEPALPMDMKGETFSHVLGTNTALFEQFVLWRNIMGPCWLKIEDPDCTAIHNASWCKLELEVRKPSNISVVAESENMEPPPLTLMSIALRTTMNAKENTQEI